VDDDATTTSGDLVVGEADPALDQRLSDELDRWNAGATPEVAPARELTVQVRDDDDLVAGVSGWTWGVAAGMAMVWVDADRRGTGVGARVVGAFEDEARRRGCTHVVTTSFTFQAPGFYERLGYEEFARWDALPTPGRADVHLRKVL